MKKLLCFVLVALLATLPCCVAEEESFYKLNREEIEYYREFIPLYVNTCISNAGYDGGNYSMDRLDILDFSSQSLYKMSNGTAEIDVCFAGVPSEIGVKTIAVACPLDDNLRADVSYLAALLAFPSLFAEMLDLNDPGSISVGDMEEMMVCVANYMQATHLDEEYCFMSDKYMVSIWYESNAVHLWFDIL